MLCIYHVYLQNFYWAGIGKVFYLIKDLKNIYVLRW